MPYAVKKDDFYASASKGRNETHDCVIDEISGKGNSLNTFYRQNDTQIGQWTTIDPKADLYLHNFKI